ncbi:unnamed protein product [Cylindrotheca closterium]|uniref:PDZ domain-containing protein n=1 Tax=Cylindrotheca closterium TaxID=2856 RepID=A0AAD2FYW1_9STRA|nr:unnamed protein product [Cylindrotheca closterium]
MRQILSLLLVQLLLGQTVLTQAANTTVIGAIPTQAPVTSTETTSTTKPDFVSFLNTPVPSASTTSPTKASPPTPTPSVSTTAPTMSPTKSPTMAPTTSEPTIAPTTKNPTISPSLEPTPKPSSHPTIEPTAMPSKSPTSLPSSSPSAMPSQFPRSPVTGRAELMFRSVSGLLVGDTEESFVENTIAFLTENMPEVEAISVDIERQARQFQNRRSLREEALFIDIRVRASHIVKSDDMFNFDVNLMSVFASEEKEYVEALKNTGDPYFSSLDTIILPDTAAPTAVPSSAPSLSPIEDASLPQEYLIAIIAGAAFFVLVLLALIYRFTCSKKGKGVQNKAPSNSFFASKKQQYSNQDAGAGSDLESHQGLESPSAPSDQSSYYGGSIMQASTQMDSNSYSYSLDPGLPSSVISGKTSGSNGNAVPMEIPQIDLPASADQAMLRDSGIELTASDLQLTDSELAMLPSNLGRSADSAASSKRQRRVVKAPPGKLGIIIDTTVEGPVVHQINPGSALEGQLQPGDIIISIDDVDTRAMSASAITDLMIQTAKQYRSLTVVSNPN